MQCNDSVAAAEAEAAEAAAEEAAAMPAAKAAAALAPSRSRARGRRSVALGKGFCSFLFHRPFGTLFPFLEA